jgi:hypothetical protein
MCCGEKQAGKELNQCSFSRFMEQYITSVNERTEKETTTTRAIAASTGSTPPSEGTRWRVAGNQVESKQTHPTVVGLQS